MKLNNAIFALNNEEKSPFLESFARLLNQDLSVSKAMNLIAISSQLDAWNALYNKARMRIIQKFGTSIEGGAQYQIPKENIPEFLEDIKILNAMEFNVDGEKIDLSDEKIVLKAIDLVILRDILKDIPKIELQEELTGPEEVIIPPLES